MIQGGRVPSAVRPVRSMMDSALRGWRSMAASAALGPVGSLSRPSVWLGRVMRTPWRTHNMPVSFSVDEGQVDSEGDGARDAADEVEFVSTVFMTEPTNRSVSAWRGGFR